MSSRDDEYTRERDERIRERYAAGESAIELGLEYGLSRSQIHRIVAAGPPPGAVPVRLSSWPITMRTTRVTIRGRQRRGLSGWPRCQQPAPAEVVEPVTYVGEDDDGGRRYRDAAGHSLNQLGWYRFLSGSSTS